MWGENMFYSGKNVIGGSSDSLKGKKGGKNTMEETREGALIVAERTRNCFLREKKC